MANIRLPHKRTSAFWIAMALAICAGGLFLSKGFLRYANAQAPKDLTAGEPGLRHILVDQFGYLPDESKVAVIRTPVVGYDKLDTYAPGAEFAVRKVETGEIVLRGGLQPWDGEKVQPSSGDRGWWFDFSALTTPGSYEIVDIGRNEHSAAFEVGPDIYRKVLRVALRTYFYQRSGFAKREPYAQTCWIDDAAYLGEQQDKAARDITDADNTAKIRDMQGGWFDAGDTNKYVTFAAPVVHQLLAAFEDSPKAFTDSLGIPESGNGIPDLVNEVHWETDWFKRMQYPNGGFALKVGATQYVNGGAPSKDSSPRYYVPECTSATITGAGVLAHAALRFRDYAPLREDAKDLERRARLAWSRYESAPQLQTHCDTGQVFSGNADLNETEQNAKAAETAIYLFALTRDKNYLDFVTAHYRELRPYRDMGWGRYNEEQGHALLWLTTLDGVPTDLRRQILADFSNEVANRAGAVFGFDPSLDLYRSYLHDAQYHWGSHQPRANYGNVNLDAMRFLGASDAQKRSFRTRALATLHYFHGVNPFGMVMLSNMKGVGASRSVDQLYHRWFWPGTKWSDAQQSACGPVPGFVVGGANGNVANNGVPASAIPPVGQPLQKSFTVSNDPKIAAWTITEPAIYYQSAYIKLLAGLVQ